MYKNALCFSQHYSTFLVVVSVVGVMWILFVLNHFNLPKLFQNKNAFPIILLRSWHYTFFLYMQNSIQPAEGVQYCIVIFAISRQDYRVRYR